MNNSYCVHNTLFVVIWRVVLFLLNGVGVHVGTGVSLVLTVPSAQLFSALCDEKFSVSLEKGIKFM